MFLKPRAANMGETRKMPVPQTALSVSPSPNS
jgi:hypothetical protein